MMQAVKRLRTELFQGADNAGSTSDSANDVTALRDAPLEAAVAAAACALETAQPTEEAAPLAPPAPAAPATLFASQYGTQQSSQFRGVCWNKTTKRWQAAIYTYGRYLYLGCFADELDAARAYDLAALKTRGTKAKTNLPPAQYYDEAGALKRCPRLDGIIAVHKRMTGTKSARGGAAGGGAKAAAAGRKRCSTAAADAAAAAAAAAAQPMQEPGRPRDVANAVLGALAQLGSFSSSQTSVLPLLQRSGSGVDGGGASGSQLAAAMAAASAAQAGGGDGDPQAASRAANLAALLAGQAAAQRAGLPQFDTATMAALTRSGGSSGNLGALAGGRPAEWSGGSESSAVQMLSRLLQQVVQSGSAPAPPPQQQPLQQLLSLLQQVASSRQQQGGQPGATQSLSAVVAQQHAAQQEDGMPASWPVVQQQVVQQEGGMPASWPVAQQQVAQQEGGMPPSWERMAAAAATPGQPLMTLLPEGYSVRVWNVQQHLPPGCLLDQLVLPNQATDMVGVLYRVVAAGTWGAMLWDGLGWHHINVYASEAEARAACLFVLDCGPACADDALDDVAETGMACGEAC